MTVTQHLVLGLPKKAKIWDALIIMYHAEKFKLGFPDT